jgi:triacylglycerol esterase/lipase EstA (alpha/beta hydrolase family)
MIRSILDVLACAARRTGCRWHGAHSMLAVLAVAVGAVSTVGPASAASAVVPPPPGADATPTCVPSALHPHPVVLIHGTFANRYDNWYALSPALAQQGYCVFAVQYGNTLAGGPFVGGLGHIRDSVVQLARFVDAVAAATGVARVDLVGHSQGGLLAEYYTKFVGGAARVHGVVALSPPTHGTTAGGLATLEQQLGVTPVMALACQACPEMFADSPVVAALNSGRVTVRGVGYTVIETVHETVVTPAPEAAFIREPGVQNLLVQSYCPTDGTDHGGLAYDPTTRQLILDALDPAHAVPATC